MILNALIKINGFNITEHNRKFNSSFDLNKEEKVFISGNSMFFFKTSKNIFSFDWSYLPNSSIKTVDGYESRDYISGIVNTGSLITLSIQLSRTDVWVDYLCSVSLYSETTVKTDIPNQCRYYDVSMSLAEM